MYHFFKDFAGPIATIIAAFAAVFVTWHFAGQQEKIAKEQAHTAKEKLRLDLFERRLAIFSSIFPLYHAIIDWQGTPEQLEAREQFFRAHQESRFLFSKESGVEELLKNLNDKAAKVIGIKEHKDDFKMDKELDLKLFKEIDEIQRYSFPDGLERLRNVVSEYLDFHNI